ncbi:hypothetical protein KEM56_000019 [Ascosphaera pollenicola]|nr:hypothetical protein KEM56_000019 [Ascosphaera pollenicola]
MPDEIGLSEGTYMGAASDPDAQATVSDFIDYTEYLPADLQRSLTLIRELDERYLRATQAVHELTKTYGALPSLPDADKPDPVILRRLISEQLERAVSARECAFAEARRLYDVVDRHFDRLGSIHTKLENMSKSAPALQSVAAATTAATTAAPGEPSEKKATRTTRSTAGETTPTRLTLRLDPRKNNQNREAIDPSSPNAESPKPGLPDIGKKPLALRLKVPPTTHHKGRKGRELSNASTNEEINAIETSTRNALQMLKPPPEDAPIGSEHRPWLRLTEWELTRLRKRMKKNNVWQPSEVMVHRELAVRGRGWDNYQRARAHAKETGTELIDCDDIEHNYMPGQSIQGRDIHAGQETTLTNRGMKLNEAKKLKRENLAREAAAAAAAAGETDDKAQSPQVTRVMSRSSRSRTNKNDQTNDDGVDAVGNNIRSRQASSVATGHGAAADFSSNASQANENLSKDRESRQTRKRKPADLEIALDHDSEITSITRASRKKSKSGEEIEATSAPTDHRTTRQQQQSRAQSPEKSSGAQKAAAATTGGRRNKRPAPGPVTSSQDGGTAVSVGRRKTKPAAARQMKRESLAKEITQQAMILDQEDMRIDEDGVHEQVDPNEPRYCICGDVSFGTMICCEDDNCDKEWFHLECVGLTEVPSRTAKWYCPECRTNIARATADGIVRNGNRR